MKTQILVTGGAGYKGTVLTKKLLDKGYKVTVVDNFMYGYDSLLHIATHPNLTVVKHDIRNAIPDLKKFDVIFHLAGISGFPACASNPNSALLINVEATRMLGNMVSKDQVLINASTTSMYGKSGQPCDEFTSVEPVSTYAQTKLEAENDLMQHENVISLRFATVFGFSTRMRMDLMINDFTYKAVKEGVLVLFDSFAKRTFIHVQDAADCYLFAMENYNKMKGGIFNAGGNHLNYSKAEIANIIGEQVKYKIINSELADKDLRHFVVNFNKIANLGFVPKITVEKGVEELVKVFSFYEYFSHFRTI